MSGNMRKLSLAVVLLGGTATAATAQKGDEDQQRTQQLEERERQLQEQEMQLERQQGRVEQERQDVQARTQTVAPTGKKLTELSRRDIRRVQLALRETGFYQGDIDGIAGPQTHAALGAFQKAQGHDVTGRLDLQTANALEYGPIEIQPVRGGPEDEQQQAIERQQQEIEAQQQEIEKSEKGEETTEEIMERPAAGDKVFNKMRDWTNTNVPKDER